MKDFLHKRLQEAEQKTRQAMGEKDDAESQRASDREVMAYLDHRTNELETVSAAIRVE